MDVGGRTVFVGMYGDHGIWDGGNRIHVLKSGGGTRGQPLLFHVRVTKVTVPWFHAVSLLVVGLRLFCCGRKDIK